MCLNFRFVIALLCINSTIAYPQFKTDLTEAYNIQSPNAATLGKFGDVPVSLYTGTPQIDVPVYKLNERGVELDISLQYDARGVRVADVPGWVGQNWALNAGGVITRTVRGSAHDELNFFHGKDICSYPLQHGWLGGNGYNDLYQLGFYYHKEKLNIASWSSLSNLNNLAEISVLGPFWDSAENPPVYPCHGVNLTNWHMDLEPDLFTFNFMGHTGHFFLGHDGEWKVFSDSNLRVVCDLNTDLSHQVPSFPSTFPGDPNFTFPKALNSITLLDDNGVKYVFSQVELTFNNIISNRPRDNQASKCISSAFYLTSVSDKDNNTLYTFQYDRGPWIGQFFINYNFNEMDFNITQVLSNTSSSTFQFNWHDTGFGAPGQLILPSYLKKITTASGVTVDFNSSVSNAMKYQRYANPLFNDVPNQSDLYYGMSSPYDDLYFMYKEADMITTAYSPSTPLWDVLQWKKLDNITIKDNSNIPFTVDFNYTNTPTQRLFLYDIDFNHAKKYHFDYHMDDALPNFLSNAIDHMGYYNGNPFKFTTISRDLDFWQTELYSQREINPTYLKYGSLTKITYPTGGTTEFEFEPHAYSKKINTLGELVSNSGTISGLRIKKITNSDANGNQEIKEYQYTTGISSNVSSGHFLYNPLYYKKVGPIVHPLLGSNSGKYFYGRNLNTLISMTNFMGVYMEYSHVFEKSTNNGYTEYKFSNYTEFPDLAPINIIDSQGLSFVPKTDRSYERGRLLEQSTYTNTGTMQKRNSFKYYAQNSLLINAINMHVVFNSGNVPYYAQPFTAAYQIPYSDKYVVEEKEEIFSPSGTLSTILEYTYVRYPDLGGTIINNGSLFKKSEYTESSILGEGLLTTYGYPFELNSSLGTTMINKYVLPAISQKTERIIGDSGNPDEQIIIEEKRLDYQLSYDDLYEEYVPIPKESFLKKDTNSFEREFSYTKYDHDKNLLEYKKENGSYVALIWGYNNTKPIAKLENLQHALVPQATINNLYLLSNNDNDNCRTGTCTEQLLRNALNGLRTAFPDAMVTTYTYNPLSGVTSVTDPRGYTTYFEYDEFNQLKAVRDADGNILSENEYHYKP